MQDRRRFIRWQVDREAKVKLEGAEVFAHCTIKDISFKGLQVILGLKLPKDTFMKLKVELAKECVLEVEVWIVWHKTVDGRNAYGLYFSKITDPDKEKIYQFVRRGFPGELQRRWWDTTEKGGTAMPNGKFEDRRIFARFPARLPLKFLDLNSNQEREARTYDISAKGIGLVTSAELAPKTTLEIWLRLPEGEPLYTRGEVVWSKPTGANEYRAGTNLEKADLMGLARVLRAT